MSITPSTSAPDPSLVAAFSLLQQECDRTRNAELRLLCASLAVNPSTVDILDLNVVRRYISVLARLGAFGSAPLRLATHRAVWAIASSLGIYTASIDQLYRALAENQCDRRFTVPAINMRAIAYESARGVFEAMRESGTVAVIFELSRGEIGFTAQRPHEYATSVLCAAIAEHHCGPIFLQGDHFQISASRYQQDAQAETSAVAELIEEAISAGFYNIDIDASTLVDLSHAEIADQQALNCQLSAQLALVARASQPRNVTVSLGGEIGEVGEHNSTLQELQSYLDGVAAKLPSAGAGLSKVSIQSGTRHGGNILADGSFGDMPIDFNLIKELSACCRNQYSVGGCVQHGASMLSLQKMAQLPDAGCIEVHLAAGFLNDVYASLAHDDVAAIEHELKVQYKDEWQTDWSEAQFLHHARRYAVGMCKQQWWDNTSIHATLRQKVKQRAAAYFDALCVEQSGDIIARIITHPPAPWREPPDSLSHCHQDESTIGDLAS